MKSSNNKLYANRIIILVFFLCLNNLFMVYSITDFFDIFRAPIQLLYIAILVIKGIKFSKIEHLVTNETAKLNTFIVLFGLWLFGQVLLNTRNSATLFNDFSNSVFSLIIYLVLFSDRFDERNNTDVIWVSDVVFIVMSGMYLYFRFNQPITALPTNIYHAQYVNSIYYIIFMLPFILIGSHKMLFIGLSLLCVLASGKQGAFLALAFGLLVYYFLLSKVNDSKGKGISWKFIAGISVLIFGGYFLYQYLWQKFGMNIILGFQTIEQDGGNGRLEIYSRLIEEIKNFNFIELLFGHGGMNSVAYSLGISAHNDFLETLYDFGLIGLALYIIVILKMLGHLRISLRKKSVITPAFGYSICVFLVLSMISHLMYILKYGMLMTAFWSICVSTVNGESINESSHYST